ncbi:MAG: 50S ribosomal protein L23 [Thermodesulfobacteriota bacterium]
MKDIYQIIKGPCLTEKSTWQKENANQVCFVVDRQANKIEIKEAVERIFKAKVAAVRTQVNPGKQRRVGRNAGYSSDWKKAIVTLRPGERIEFFEGV